MPRADREAKPISHDVNFGCAKLFISIDREEAVFQSGLQVERGSHPARDYDWHRLLEECRQGTVLDKEMGRLIRREGFTARVMGSTGSVSFDAGSFRFAAQVREAARKAPRGNWAGFQLFYPMSAREVQSCSGLELVQAIFGVFAEVTEVMNQCMQVRLNSARPGPHFPVRPAAFRDF